MALDALVHVHLNKMTCVMRKPDFGICINNVYKHVNAFVFALLLKSEVTSL